MNRSEAAETAKRVYRYMMHSESNEWGRHEWADWAMNVDRWDWNAGVGLIAAGEYGTAASEDGIMREIAEWVDRNRKRSEGVEVINEMAPFAVFPSLYRATGLAYYRDEAESVALRMMERSPRTRNGAFEHTVTENAIFREQIWADTVFVAVLFLARTARLLSDRRMAEEALRQVRLHLNVLQDEDTGLLYHGWNCETEDWMSAARWNRANAWNVCAVPMILEETKGLCESSETLEEIARRYVRLIEAVATRQNPSGLWPTVLDRPDFYEETSGSAGLACGIYKAVRLGLVPAGMKACADRAVPAVIRKIAATGAVDGVSGGTPVLESVEAYDRVPVFPTLYGQGLTLMLLAEAAVSA
ncbi:glycoside hydrolase family 88 protein [Cohnella terricola]|uniref:Glycosyl hydrolase n=1 Tax=Cohnella terricola TaxID=1289167 RepID=A0A559JMX3_9BACL|nr:glycoside hydrolase family 88 protein [Cohnella terricola]TVY01222.1 glycosyl hydrolase [Cohnella terricola]